jgi:heat shock protein HslJ/uncharacterized membrane protein
LLAATVVTAIFAVPACKRTRTQPPSSPAAPAVPSTTAADSPWEKARLQGVEFRAIGQEPGWLVELDQGRELRYTGDYGETRFTAPAPEPVRDAASGTIIHTARADSRELVVIIREAECQDAMSGEPFPLSVIVRYEAKELRGCGRTLMTDDLLGVYWKLVELSGVAAPATDKAREAHLRFAAEGSRVSGSTGCNSMSGSVSLASDRLRFGPVATTRMACLDPAIAHQEQEFLRALQAADRFSLAGGQLTLYAAEKAVARFAAMYLH